MGEISVVRVKTQLPLRWRTRLRIWWFRRRMTPEQRAIDEELSCREARALLFGDDAG